MTVATARAGIRFDTDALAARDAQLRHRPAPKPAYATRLDPTLRNRGQKIYRASQLLGEPLIPWQLDAAKRATQMNPEGSELLWRYQLVIIVVPRQAGKTSLLRSVLTDRALHRPGSALFATAQSGKYASNLWANLSEKIKNSPLKHYVKAKSGKGSEVLTFPGRSTLEPFPPTRDSLHSQTPNFVLIDEGWSQTLDSAAALMQAVRPAMITRRDRQIWIISAMGDERSAWLDQLIEQGRASLDDPNSTTCYIEYAPDPESDPYDPEVWEYHPGLGWLITLQDLAQEAQPTANTHADFMRSFMNISLKNRSTVVDLDRWTQLGDLVLTGPPDPSTWWIGFDVAIDLSSASIWCAGMDEAGQVGMAPIEVRDGTDWLVPVISELHRAGWKIAADDDGEARTTTDALNRAGVPVKTMGVRESDLAWSDLKARIKNGTVHHTGSAAFAGALAAAVERPAGDIMRLSRRHSRGPIDPLMAGLAALHHATRPADVLPIG